MLSNSIPNDSSTNFSPYFSDHDECEQLGDRQQSMNHGIGGHFCTQANSICVNTLGSYKCKLHERKKKF